MTDRKLHENFEKALTKLQQFVAEPILTERDRAGVLQAFEFTFEQCWKTFQKFSQQEGIEAQSPRQSLQSALQLSLISQADEDLWLEMMKDRNLSSHLYREEIARRILDAVIRIYLPLMKGAFESIRARA